MLARAHVEAVYYYLAAANYTFGAGGQLEGEARGIATGQL